MRIQTAENGKIKESVLLFLFFNLTPQGTRFFKTRQKPLAKSFKKINIRKIMRNRKTCDTFLLFLILKGSGIY